VPSDLDGDHEIAVVIERFEVVCREPGTAR